jgi:serpin B
MNRRSFLWASFALGCSACGGSIGASGGQRRVVEGSATRPPNEAALVSASNRFAFDLWAKLSRGATSNLAVSPASISVAFAMAYGGARGRTAAEMAEALHLDEAPGVHEGYGALLRYWNSSRTAYELAVANRLFGQRSLRFEDAFVSLTRDAYGAELERLDFAADPERSREHINAWIEEKTHDRIQNLLGPGSITPGARLVLTNAIYFKGKWLREFEREATRAVPFHRGANDAVQVQTMHQTAEHRFARVDGVSVLELPYVGDELSMVLVLPDERDGLASLESRMDAAAFDGWLAALHPAEIEVALPRFEIDPPGAMSLEGPLRELGMALPFEADADFGGMTRDTSLYIDDAYHKAFVEVNEEGTEAAGATAIVMVEASAMMPPAFRADHPFLFFIRDTVSGAVLFMGKVLDPS